jgi:uncharacterized membrane protein
MWMPRFIRNPRLEEKHAARPCPQNRGTGAFPGPPENLEAFADPYPAKVPQAHEDRSEKIYPRPLSGEERRLAFFGAFCLFLSTLEFLIPKPLPFMRIGLANLPILLALRLYPPRFTLALTALKILGQGIINGTLFSYIFLFSSAGSLTSALIMLGCVRIFGERMSLIGISLLGSLASNSVQILFARFFCWGKGPGLSDRLFWQSALRRVFCWAFFPGKCWKTQTG